MKKEEFDTIKKSKPNRHLPDFNANEISPKKKRKRMKNHFCRSQKKAEKTKTMPANGDRKCRKSDRTREQKKTNE
jgi:hypothetical protein